jgi:hypothetical protein
MPRRNVTTDTLDTPPDVPVLRLLTATPGQTGGHHPHRGDEGRLDAYLALPGAVAGPAHPAPARRPRAGSRAARELAAQEDEAAKMIRVARYDAYLDALVMYAGDSCKALATVFGIELEEAREKYALLLDDVHRGQGESGTGALLARNDLAIEARIKLLRRHAYSEIPAASLKALDMIDNIDGDSGSTGSYDQYVRSIMGM